MVVLPHHPGQGVRRVQEKTKERTIVELAEIKTLFAEPWSDMRAYAACVLAATTGARMGEVRGLQIRNLHLDEGYIDIVTKYVHGDGLKGPKQGNDRIGVRPHAGTIRAIRAALRMHPFRHTYVSHLRRMIPEARVIKIIRHATTLTTDEYTHTSEEDRRSVKEAVERLLSA